VAGHTRALVKDFDLVKSKKISYSENSIAAKTRMPDLELLISWISRENKYLRQADFLTH
jgi:hypothetical protein